MTIDEMESYSSRSRLVWDYFVSTCFSCLRYLVQTLDEMKNYSSRSRLVWDYVVGTCFFCLSNLVVKLEKLKEFLYFTQLMTTFITDLHNGASLRDLDTYVMGDQLKF